MGKSITSALYVGMDVHKDAASAAAGAAFHAAMAAQPKTNTKYRSLGKTPTN